MFDAKDDAFPADVIECYKQASGEAAEMWSAGVIGLKGEVIETVCSHALRVSDAIQIRHPKKIEYAEQYGFSAACSNFKKLSANREVSHYWNKSREVEAILNQMSFDEIARIHSEHFHQIYADSDKLRHNTLYRINLKIRHLKRSWTKRKRELLAARLRQQSKLD